MPAVSILKKPFGRRRNPPPPPAPAAVPPKPPVPPKPKRGVPPPPPAGHRGASAALKGEGVRFVDDDEPTTEESYDYKDIDFASEIFDFRVPTRRSRSPPPPPLQLQNGSAVKLAGEATELEAAIAAIDNGAVDAPPEEGAPSDAGDGGGSDEDDDDDELDEIKTDDLAKFLAEHEGKELTLEDVRKLEQLLDEVERKESGHDDRPEVVESKPKALPTKADGPEPQAPPSRATEFEPQAPPWKVVESEPHAPLRRVLGSKPQAPLQRAAESPLPKVVEEEAPEQDVEEEWPERVPAVRFGVAEIIEDGRVVVEEELRGGASSDDDGDEAEDREKPHAADYSDVQFRGDGAIPNRRTAEAMAIYEPVGQPDLRFLRPDLSGYVPPTPSSNVGDPFSWRRRGKRRHDDYGYHELRLTGRKVPAKSKILNGCVQVEQLIASRDLSPPGMLLDVLEPSSLERMNRKKKKVGPPSPPPPPPLVAQEESNPQAPPEPDVAPIAAEVEEIPSPPEGEAPDEMDLERMDEVESQILTADLMSVESLIVPVDLKQETVVGGASTVAADENGDVLEAPVQKVTSYETGATVEVPDPGPVFVKREVTYEAAPVDADVAEPLVAPRRLSRRDGVDGRPPRPRPPRFASPPVRPERRKRVASADPLLTAYGLERMELERLAPPPRSKAKRSVSFHTAEDIRRKIDVQAQLFLRTPRRKDRSTPDYRATCPSASASLVYGQTLCRPRPPLTPVYSSINKDAIARKKEAAAQTGNGDDDDAAAEAPPPPLPQREVVVEDDEPAPADDRPAEESEAVRETEEDSEIPAEFRILSGAVEGGSVAPFEDRSVVSETPMDDVAPASAMEEGDSGVQNRSVTSPATRPLPPPPAPPRHRTAKNSSSSSAVVDSPVVFCSIIPQKGETLTGKLTVVPELKVLRLSVVQLDASLLRVAQLEADHLVTHRLDEIHESSTPSPQSFRQTQPPPPPDGDTPSPQPPPLSGAESLGPSGHLDGQSGHCDPGGEEVPKGGPQDPAATAAYGLPRTSDPGPDINSNWSGPDDPWELGCFVGRAGCESPLTGATSTTSGSASYVTCDETLHDDSELTNAFDQCSVDGSFGFDEDATDGCLTPTELELDVGPFGQARELWDGPVPPTPSLSSLSSLSTLHSDTTLTSSSSALPQSGCPAVAVADENCNLPTFGVTRSDHSKSSSVSHREPAAQQSPPVLEEGMAPSVTRAAPSPSEQTPVFGQDSMDPPLTNGDGQLPAPTETHNETG